MDKCYFNQTGEYQADLDELNRRIGFLRENGKFNEKYDYIIGKQYSKLDRFRKVLRAYNALHETGKPSARLLGTGPKDIAKGGEYPQAEAALEAAIIAAKNEPGEW